WLLGYIGWRNLTLPLLSFEVASGSRAEIGRNARIAVLNAIGDRPGTPFLALLLQGIPRALKVDADLPAATSTLAPPELAAVRIGDELAKIPDLEGLEQKLADAGLIGAPLGRDLGGAGRSVGRHKAGPTGTGGPPAPQPASSGFFVGPGLSRPGGVGGHLGAVGHSVGRHKA